MAAVDQRQQLHSRGAAVIEQSVQSRANGAARIQHVVHEDHVFGGDGEGNVGGVHHRLVADRG